MVCTGVSGHAEIVTIHYDTQIISLHELLDIFFVVHNPTTLNMQGNDKGTQYRSVVYYANEEEKKIIHESILKAQQNYQDTIVTEVSPLADVYPAEEYHQN
jgi:peptide-methionine (S)-S-oxide reductase